MKLITKRFVVLMMLLLLTSVPLSADNLVYGELDLKLDTNRLVQKDKFKAKNQQQGRLEIINGAGWPKARSVIVVLNGKKVVPKGEVTKKVKTYSVDVTLKANNTIKITVRGRASRVKLQIVATSGGGGGGGGGGGTPKGIFGRLAGYGDSLMAGFQNGSLVETLQVNNFASLIAAQVNAKFVLPLISEPGIPTQLIETKDGTIKIDPDSKPGERINPGERLHNFAVPGATTGSSIRVKSLGGNPLFEIILGGNRTMLTQVKKRKPTFTFLWIGANDVLGMVLSTDPSDHTATEDFKSDYETILKQLTGAGIKVVAANIPDIMTIALLIKPTSFLKLFIPEDAVFPITLLLEVLAGKRSLGSITADDYLTPDEVAKITATVEEFNAEIASLCSKYGVPLVDMYSITREWDKNGIDVDGLKLTTEYRGGIFSLDAIHPTNTIHAVIANEFIDVINKGFGTSIARVDVAAVMAADPNPPMGTTEDYLSSPPGDPNRWDQMLRILRASRRSFTTSPRR